MLDTRGKGKRSNLPADEQGQPVTPRPMHKSFAAREHGAALLLLYSATAATCCPAVNCAASHSASCTPCCSIVLTVLSTGKPSPKKLPGWIARRGSLVGHAMMESAAPPRGLEPAPLEQRSQFFEIMRDQVETAAVDPNLKAKSARHLFCESCEEAGVRALFAAIRSSVHAVG